MAKRKTPSDNPAEENLNNINDDDNFGLPDIEYKPLDAPQQPTAEPEITADAPSTAENTPVTEYKSESSGYNEPPKEEYKPSYSYDAGESKSNATAVISIVIGLVVVIAGFLIYQFVYKPQMEKEKKELALKKEREEADRKKKEEQDRLDREEAERKRREAEAAANATPPPGTIESLAERTGRYYVVISSAVDGDLVMDYAKKLGATGVSSKIIPPFGKFKFFRLAVADEETFALAQAKADEMKATYGSSVWVIKY